MSGDNKLVEALCRFDEWLAREIPPGTIINNPHWWAPRIYRAVLAAHAAETAQPKAQSGEWQIKIYPNGKVRLCSSNFENDVDLEISGDFATPQELRAYAESLATRLNAPRQAAEAFNFRHARALMGHVMRYCDAARLRTLSSDAISCLKELDAMLAAAPTQDAEVKSVRSKHEQMQWHQREAARLAQEIVGDPRESVTGGAAMHEQAQEAGQ